MQKQTATLQIDIQTVSSNWELVWSTKGDKAATWSQGSINLALYRRTYIRLRITAVRGKGEASDIAIDELQFSRRCNTPATYCTQLRSPRKKLISSKRGDQYIDINSMGHIMADVGSSAAGPLVHTAPGAFGRWVYFMLGYDHVKQLKYLSFENITTTSHLPRLENLQTEMLTLGHRDADITFNELRLWSSPSAAIANWFNRVDESYKQLRMLIDFDQGKGQQACDQTTVSGYCTPAQSIQWIASPFQLPA